MVKRPMATIATAAALLAGCSSTKAAAPDPIDVKAAHACHEFDLYLNNKAVGGDLQAAAEPLIAGSADAQASGLPAPKWSDLGADLISFIADSVAQDSAKQVADGNAAADQCTKLSRAAKDAGGYTK